MKRVRSGLGQDRGCADRREAVDAGDQLSQPELVEDGDQALVDLDELGVGVVEVVEDPADPFERGTSVFQHPGRVVEGGEKPCHDPPAGTLVTAADQLATDLVLETGQTSAPGQGEVAAVAGDDYVERGDPGVGFERVLRGLESRGPDALQQGPDLLDRLGMDAEQPGPSLP